MLIYATPRPFSAHFLSLLLHALSLVLDPPLFLRGDVGVSLSVSLPFPSHVLLTARFMERRLRLLQLHRRRDITGQRQRALAIHQSQKISDKYSADACGSSRASRRTCHLNKSVALPGENSVS